jgi:3-hydroxypropanoate dehydrogenase
VVAAARRRIVNDEALDTLFRAARNRDAWLDREVSDTLLRALWELVKRGPASGVAGPARVLFVRSPAAKDRLASAVPDAARVALKTAPVVAVIGCPPEAARAPAASREGGLRAACLILAARALGLDCGPIWEFDGRRVDDAFFPEGSCAATVLCAIGYGDEVPRAANPPPQSAPADADEACTIL